MSRLASLVLVVLLSVAAGGTGAWLWDVWKTHRAEQAAELALAAAEAERKTPRGIQRETIKKWLNDPDSAQFRDDRPALRGVGMWCGEVNARNRMGGMAGFTRYVAEVNADRELAMLDQVHFDGSVGSSSFDAKHAAFGGMWRAYCE